MYFVDRKKIEAHLQYMDQLIGAIPSLQEFETFHQKLALERTGHLLIECMMDAGNSIIDGFIMRDPGSFEDILDILLDEKVIAPPVKESLNHVLGLRKMLVQDYCWINHSIIADVLYTHQKALFSFPESVRRYLEEELGPVSAFLPDEE